MRVFTNKRIFLYTQTLCMQVMYGIPVTQTRLSKSFSDLFEIKYTDLFILLHFITRDALKGHTVSKNGSISFYTECPQGMTCLGFGRVSFSSSVS